MAEPSPKRKLSIYIPGFVLREMEIEAKRLDRPLSWLIHRAWRIGYAKMKAEREGQKAVTVAKAR